MVRLDCFAVAVLAVAPSRLRFGVTVARLLAAFFGAAARFLGAARFVAAALDWVARAFLLVRLAARAGARFDVDDLADLFFIP